MKPSFMLLPAFLAFSVRAQNSALPDLWYEPPSNLPAPMGYVRDADFPHLFDSPVTWPKALSRIQVFGIPRSYVVKASDDDLRRIFDFLNAYQISLAVEWPVVDGTVNGLGEGVEGVNHSPHVSLKIARRLKSLHAHLVYLVTDEPLCFGHYFTRGHSKIPGGPERIGNQYSIAEVARQSAADIREVREIFPTLKVVETEPASPLKNMEEFNQWLVTLKQDLGEIPLAGIDLDVQWERPWQQACSNLVSVIARNKLSYGLIVDGGPHDASSLAWVRHAQDNLNEWGRTISVPPNRLRFQSWHPYPDHVLPETDPETILSLINSFTAAHPDLPPKPAARAGDGKAN